MVGVWVAVGGGVRVGICVYVDDGIGDCVGVDGAKEFGTEQETNIDRSNINKAKRIKVFILG
jgi:hypothetical protein